MLAVETLKHVESDGNIDLYEEPEGDYTDFLSQNSNSVTIVTDVERGKGGETDEAGVPVRSPEAPFEPSSQTINGVESSLQEHEPSEAELSALLALEREGKDRKGAKTAIKEYKND